LSNYWHFSEQRRCDRQFGWPWNLGRWIWTWKFLKTYYFIRSYCQQHMLHRKNLRPRARVYQCRFARRSNCSHKCESVRERLCYIYSMRCFCSKVSARGWW
jgi:hypothetical protein